MKGLFNANEAWQEEESKMEEIVVKYYNNHFTISNPEDFTELINAIQPKVSRSMNEELT